MSDAYIDVSTLINSEVLSQGWHVATWLLEHSGDLCFPKIDKQELPSGGAHL